MRARQRGEEPADAAADRGGTGQGGAAWAADLDRDEERERQPVPPGFGGERMDVVARLFEGLARYGSELFSGATNGEVALAVSWFAGTWLAHHAYALGMSREEATEMAEGLIGGVVTHEMTERTVGHA